MKRGNMKPDDGTVSVRKGVRLSMVVQDPVFPADSTAREIILAAAADSAEGIRQGLEDVKKGRVRRVEDFFREFEAKHGLSSEEGS